MSIAFNDFIGKIIQVYLDDLTVYSKRRIDHFDHLARAFARCKKYGISLILVKSIFGIKSGKLLGNIQSYYKISIDPN